MPRTAPKDIETMAEIRACIDEIDDELIALLAEREAYTNEVPALKLKEGIAAAAPARVAAVLAHVRDKAAARGFDPELAEAMWQLMIDAVIAREEAVMGKEGKDA